MVDPDVWDDSDTPLPLAEEGPGRFSKTGWSEFGENGGKNGEEGTDGRDDVDVDPCEEALAFVLRLSGTSTVREGCSGGNCRRSISGIRRSDLDCWLSWYCWGC